MMSGLGSVVAAYVRDHTTEGAFAPAFGAITLIFGAAHLVGPELDGLLAEQSGGFREAFLGSALAAFVGCRCVRESRAQPHRLIGRPLRFLPRENFNEVRLLC